MTKKKLGRPRNPEQVCKIDHCDGIATAKGYCNTHYKRSLKGLDLNTPIIRKMRNRMCKAPDCKTRAKSKGYCEHHYNKFVRYARRKPKKETDPDLSDLKKWSYQVAYTQWLEDKARLHVEERPSLDDLIQIDF